MGRDPVRGGAAWLAGASTAVLLLCAAFFVPYLGSGTELVRLRNAMVLIGSGPASDFDWAPASALARFRQERRASASCFVDLVERLQPEVPNGNLGRWQGIRVAFIASDVALAFLAAALAIWLARRPRGVLPSR